MEHLYPEPQVYENTLVFFDLMSYIEDRLVKGATKVKKYIWRTLIVAILVLGVILIGRPLISLVQTSMEIRELNKQKAIYKESIHRDSTLIENLKNNEFLEEYAREKFHMQGNEEQVYILK